jgi:hypothetical protein
MATGRAVLVVGPDYVGEPADPAVEVPNRGRTTEH